MSAAWRRALRGGVAAGIVVLAACGGRGTGYGSAPILSADQAEAEISAIVQQALQADAAASDAAELYAEEAVVVADGARRLTYPRYAAIDAGGMVAVGSSRVEVGPTLAWVYVDYRWVAADQSAGRGGLATFVLSPRGPAGWQIVHAHSSTSP